MAQEYFLLSNFGVRYFMGTFVDSETVPTDSSAMDEITSVISCNIGVFTKETAKYRTLNGSGWESVAPLGQSSEDGEFECIREGTGGVWTGKAGESTFSKVKNWFFEATKGGGSTASKVIVEVVPRGENQYEGTAYMCIPSKFDPATKDTESGQTYNFSVTPFGPQIPLTVTYSDTDDKFTFAKASAGGE